MDQNKPILGMKSTMNDGYQLNVKRLFDRGMINQPDSWIITHTSNGKTHRMQYREFMKCTCLLATALYTKYNIYIGDIVSTFMWNNVRHMALYYTIPCIGSVLNPLNIRLHATELSYIISHSQPKVIFIDENLLPNFEKVLNVNPLKTVVVFIICGDNQLKSTYLGKHPLLLSRSVDYDDFINNHGGNGTFDKWAINLHETSGCFLNYTSGTTGNPKGVLNSHRSTSLRTLLELDRYCASDCILGLPPMFHACGWGMPFIAMTTGAKIVLNNTCNDYNVLTDSIMREGVTCICGVPTMIKIFCNKLQENPSKYMDKLRVREVRCGGACPPHLIRYLHNKWKIELSHGWGMTECMPGCYSQRLQRRRDLFVSTENDLIQNQLKQGTFNPSMESLFVDTENGEVLSKNGVDVGELLIKGPCITDSYFKMNDVETRNKYFTKDGYLRTGDIVSISDKDEMRIVDRSKDLIKSGGEWIASADMENYVLKLGENEYDNNIKCCAVVGQAHPRWDERPILVIEREDKGNVLQPKKENIVKHLKLKYAKFQLVDDILFWDRIPLTGTGKKSKKMIRQKLKEENYLLPQLRKKSKL